MSRFIKPSSIEVISHIATTSSLLISSCSISFATSSTGRSSLNSTSASSPPKTPKTPDFPSDKTLTTSLSFETPKIFEPLSIASSTDFPLTLIFFIKNPPLLTLMFHVKHFYISYNFSSFLITVFAINICWAPPIKFETTQ